MITVFTPAYNRAHLLSRLYESLKLQTFKDFEWIVVDDGSIDNTKEVMAKLLEEGAIKLRFFSQENGGKHMATNKGVAEAYGELFFNVDSDDFLTPNALQEIDSAWNLLSQKSDFDTYLGIGANRITPEGQTIGGAVKYDILDTNMSAYRYKYFKIIYQIGNSKLSTKYKPDFLSQSTTYFPGLSKCFTLSYKWHIKPRGYIANIQNGFSGISSSKCRLFLTLKRQ